MTPAAPGSAPERERRPMAAHGNECQTFCMNDYKLSKENPSVCQWRIQDFREGGGGAHVKRGRLLLQSGAKTLRLEASRLTTVTDCCAFRSSPVLAFHLSLNSIFSIGFICLAKLTACHKIVYRKG